MTGKDKTEEQLLSSIRKNKPAASEAAHKPAAKQARPRRTAATRSKPEPAVEPAVGTTYQYGRRVWPD